jgi:hypothetical protein
MAVVLKTTEPETVPGVRIPLPPPSALRSLRDQCELRRDGFAARDEIAPKRASAKEDESLSLRHLFSMLDRGCTRSALGLRPRQSRPEAVA